MNLVEREDEKITLKMVKNKEGSLFLKNTDKNVEVR